jgi:serine/threonine protein phosphatase PrpC
VCLPIKCGTEVHLTNRVPALKPACRHTPIISSQELVSLAAQLGSMDNITALVIRLAGWGKFDNPEDVRLRQQAYTYSRGGRFRPLAFT